MGHEVKTLPVHDDLGEIRRLVTEWKPHIAFNLLEGFDDITIFDQNVVSHLELLKLPYTGCNPRGLLHGARQIAVEEAARLPPHRRAGVRGLPHRAPDPPAEAPAVSADREIADAGSVDRHLPGVRRRQRREAQGARRLHPRKHRHRGHRRAVHRRPRDLRRHSRQSGAAGDAGLGAVLHQHARRRQADCDRPREVEREVSEEIRDRQRAGARPARGPGRQPSSTCASAPSARSS